MKYLPNLRNNLKYIIAIPLLLLSWWVLSDYIKVNRIRNEQINTLYTQCDKLHQCADISKNGILELSEASEMYKALGINLEGKVLYTTYTPSDLIGKLIQEERDNELPPFKEFNNQARARVIERFDKAISSYNVNQ